MGWRALGGYLALVAAGLLLATRLPPGGGPGAVPAAAAAGVQPQAGRPAAAGDVLAWLATGSTDGPFALLRAVLPGIGATPDLRPAQHVSASPQLPDPPDNLHQMVHRPVAADAPAPSSLTVYGVRPLVLVYETDPAADAVAQRLATDLFSGYGIPAAHLRTAFAGLDPYLAAQAGVEAVMRRHPTIRILLDIHTDAAPAAASVEGLPTAPVLIVVGDDQTLPEPHWRENAAWAVQLAQAVERAYPGLLRSYLGGLFYADGGRFDQQLSPAALLLEIGGRGVPAPLELRGADLLAKVLGPMIRAGRYPGASP